ncbi:MAG: TolC family protein [Bacteriovorax sp.]|nr:TolC family protein [Bacteriovorax sp.]
MTNKIQFILLMGVLAFSKSTFSQEADTNELTDEPQTLPSTDTTPKTEVIPAPDETKKEASKEETSKEEASKEEVPKEETATPDEVKAEPIITPEPKKTKSPILSEEDLLTPSTDAKKKRSDEKVRSKQVSESEIYIQEADKYKLSETFKNLQLNDVIEQGLRKNYEQNIRGQFDTLNEIQYQGAKNAFWLPELKINLTTTNQRISTLRSSSRPPADPNPTTPSGSLGLSLGNYTVFNWGKDYALYLNKKSLYSRNKQIFDESKRELKLDLISTYFFLMSSKNIEKIRQDQLRQASFLYRLNKEKITIGKTSKQEYYLARSEYLKAQNDYHDAKISADTADESMAFLIADEIGTKYVLNEGLDYRRIKITLDDSISISAKNNPTLLTNKTLIENAERSYDVALKENMPLPKFTVNLGAYNKKFGPTTNTTTYETYSGSGNVELVASLNATWSLTGEDGFLNSNKLAIGRIGKEIAFKEFEKNSHFTQSIIRQTYLSILSLQNQIVILEARLPSLQKAFDTILENYLSGKTKYYDFHLVLDELTTTKILFEQTKLQHLKEKINLAKLAGIEDFPGENFEQLAVRIKGK